MFSWLRRVLGGFGGAIDLVARVEELEREAERIRARVTEHELEWMNQVDKLAALHRRASKRIQDGTAALAEASPTVTDVRAARAARKAALRGGRLSG